MGQQMLTWYRNKNIQRVAALADSKSRSQSPGAVPPRVAAAAFEAASYANNAFVAEYLSGVLASSRSEDGTDDRGVTWTALVSRLSSDQLALHYCLYSIVRSLAVGKTFEVATDLFGEPIFAEFSAVLALLGTPSSSRLMDALYGLHAEGLIADTFHHGDTNYLRKAAGGRWKDVPETPQGGVVFAASARGTALFLQAHGYGERWFDAMTEQELNFEPQEDFGSDLSLVSGILIADLPPTDITLQS
jgi:hypothetical protein